VGDRAPAGALPAAARAAARERAAPPSTPARGTASAAARVSRPARAQAARLVRWLTQQSPAVRPSAPEVLRSALLPPDVADEQLTDLLRAIPERPETATRVTDALFALPTDAGVPLDEVAGAPVAMPPKVAAPLPSGPRLQCGSAGPERPARARRRWRRARPRSRCCAPPLRCTARCPWVRAAPPRRARAAPARRAARAGPTPGGGGAGGRKLGFRAPGAPPDTAALLAASGARLAARHEMRGPFAAWLARRAAMLTGGDAAALDALRRYEVGGPAKRADAPTRGGGRAAPPPAPQQSRGRHAAAAEACPQSHGAGRARWAGCGGAAWAARRRAPTSRRTWTS